MIPISQTYSNPATLPCESQYVTLLDMTIGTQNLLLGLVLAIGLGMYSYTLK